MLNSHAVLPFPGRPGEALPPILADFRRDDKSILISSVVVRGIVRLMDLGLAFAAGIAIALLYVDRYDLAADRHYLAMAALTASTSAPASAAV